MERKRDGLVPIGEALGSLGGPMKAIHDASPQTKHHFTRFAQVNELVGASEADPDLGFMARMMALCSLPRINPGDRIQYRRVNGSYKLVMIAGADKENCLMATCRACCWPGFQPRLCALNPACWFWGIHSRSLCGSLGFTAPAAGGTFACETRCGGCFNVMFN